MLLSCSNISRQTEGVNTGQAAQDGLTSAELANTSAMVVQSARHSSRQCAMRSAVCIKVGNICACRQLPEPPAAMGYAGQQATVSLVVLLVCDQILEQFVQTSISPAFVGL